MHKRFLGWLVVSLAVSLAACGGCNDTPAENNIADVDAGTDTGEVPPFTWAVDDSIQPFTASLHPIKEGGEDRPLSAVGGADQPTASFVRNELVVFSDDQDAVDAFVERIGGELLLSEDPKESGVEGPVMHLVRVEASEQDGDQFEADLRALAALDEEEPYELTGDFAFSDQQGAELIALAAHEQLESGLQIGVDWVAQPDSIPESTEEAWDATSMSFRDAYDFDWFARDSGMRTGVLDAWGLLFNSGRLGNRVPLAVLDMGFHATDDLQNISSTTVWPGFGPMDRENSWGCSGGHPCPWHGTDVAGAAMGVPDNQFGSAGPAGPVADPILVYTTYDYIASITAVYRARNRGARIINMSYSAGVPWWLKWTTAGFRYATSAVRDSGVLLFAAAGSEGADVDSKKCVLGVCWERTFYTPCENGGVTCVGGLSGPNALDDSSNDGESSVDLYGPWCVDVGNNPDDDEYHQSCGTSLASPFVAGVAALVWAANPGLSATDVSRILSDTADGYRDKKVNAYQGVLTAIGSQMSVAIIDPAPGSERYVGIPSPVVVDTTIVSQPGADYPVHLTLTSSLDGVIGEQDIMVSRASGDVHTERTYFTYDFSEGLHDLVVVAEHSRGDDWWSLPPVVASDESTFLLSNPRPMVSIESPMDGEMFCSGQTVAFRATAQDLNQSIPNDAYSWMSLIDSNPYPIFFVLGQGPTLTTDVLPTGPQQVTVSVTDDGGQISNASVDIEVIPTSDPLCSDRPPQVVITSPTDGLVAMASGIDSVQQRAYLDVTLQATATDYEDDDSTLDVEWSSDLDGALGTGTTLNARLWMDDPCSTTHTITVRTMDSDGNIDEDSITIHIYVVC